MGFFITASAACCNATALPVVFRLPWKPSISCVVALDSTFHWLATRLGLPAMKRAQDMPIMPSALPALPRPVSQPESTTRLARRLRSIKPRVSSMPASGLPSLASSR